MFIYEPEAFTVASNVKFNIAPFAILKLVQVIVCVPKLKEPPLDTVPVTNEYPKGNMSSTLTPVASEFVALASLLKTEIVNVTISPTFTLLGVTLFVSSKSEIGRIVIVTWSEALLHVPFETVHSKT